MRSRNGAPARHSATMRTTTLNSKKIKKAAVKNRSREMKAPFRFRKMPTICALNDTPTEEMYVW